MMTVKPRKQGNALVMPIPQAFNIKENTEYAPAILPDGTLQFVPVLPEIWRDDPKDIDAFNQMIGSQDDLADYGRENIGD